MCSVGVVVVALPKCRANKLSTNLSSQCPSENDRSSIANFIQILAAALVRAPLKFIQKQEIFLNFEFSCRRWTKCVQTNDNKHFDLPKSDSCCPSKRQDFLFSSLSQSIFLLKFHHQSIDTRTGLPNITTLATSKHKWRNMRQLSA